MVDHREAGEIPTMILHHLANGSCCTIDELANSLSLTRRQVSDGACRLIFRDHAERIEKGCYQLTSGGLAAAEAGEVIKAGPWRPDTAKVRKPVKDTFRERLWTAMRMSATFTIGDVVIAAARGDKNPENNASLYVRYLKAAGYIVELPVRQRGTRMTSNGFKRYRLLRDSGPVAPAYRPKLGVVHDFNTGEDVKCDRLR